MTPLGISNLKFEISNCKGPNPVRLWNLKFEI